MVQSRQVWPLTLLGFDDIQLDHEIAKLERFRFLPSSPEAARSTINQHYLRHDGLVELRELLASGRYRVDVPEEAALLTAAWLFTYGHDEPAQSLLRSIKPMLGTLRFYPRPHDQPLSVSTTGVSLESVDDTIQRLRDKEPQPQVEKQREALTVWAPMYDLGISLVLKTADADGAVLAHIPSGWAEEVRTYLALHEEKRTQHQLCTKPDNPKESYYRLREHLRSVIRTNPTLPSEGNRKGLRHIVEGYLKKRGSVAEAVEAREKQLVHAARPGHYTFAYEMASRLEPHGGDEGYEGVESLTEGMPESTARTALRCLQAEPEELIKRGLIPSPDVLAEILPRWTARKAIAAIENPALKGLYVSAYTAFRKRRSLLLLNYQRQVQFDELPWVQAIAKWVNNDANTKRGARGVLREVALLNLRFFAHRLVPNPLVKELKALIATAGLEIPLNEELAADIFMGDFSKSFVAAARFAAQRLRGSLYARYYGVDYEALLAAGKEFRLGPFVGSSGRDWSRSTAQNGQIIEQAQIVTTHNFAQLVFGLELEQEVAASALQIAQACFTWITEFESQVVSDWRAELHRKKDCAYAWRQMVFVLSLATAETVAEFIEWARAVKNANVPRLTTLEMVQAGYPSFEKDRFLGWR